MESRHLKRLKRKYSDNFKFKEELLMASTEIQFRIDTFKKEEFKRLCGEQGMATVLKEFIDNFIENNGGKV